MKHFALLPHVRRDTSCHTALRRSAFPFDLLHNHCSVHTSRQFFLRRPQEPLSFLGTVFERVAFCSSYFSFNFILITYSDDITALIFWTAEEICLLLVRSGHNSWIGIHLRQRFVYLKCAFTKPAIRRRNYASFLNTVVDRGVIDQQVTNFKLHLRSSKWVS